MEHTELQPEGNAETVLALVPPLDSFIDQIQCKKSLT